MTARAGAWLEAAERWRAPTLIGVSVAAHLIVLGGLAVRSVAPMRAPDVDQPSILLIIEPRPLFQGETARPAPAPPEVEAAPTAAITRALVPPSRKDEEERDGAAPSPRLAQPAPGAPPPPADSRWTVAPESFGDRMARNIRLGPVGCNMRNGRMSPEEQAVCDRDFNEAASRARPIEGTRDRRRDARFAQEGAREIRRYDAQRAPLAGGTGVVGPADCVGSNFGTGCAGAHLEPRFRQGARTPLQQPSNKVD